MAQIGQVRVCQSSCTICVGAISNSPERRFGRCPVGAARRMQFCPVLTSGPLSEFSLQNYLVGMISNNRLKWDQIGEIISNSGRGFYGTIRTKQILAALRDDARASLSDLATALRLSRTHGARATGAVANQNERFLGFTVVTRSDVRADPVRGLMMIEIEGRGDGRITRTLAGMAPRARVHSTMGGWDVIVEIRRPKTARGI